MAGHSHWAGIKHKKGKADKQRSAIFSKLSREITVAAKLGDKNPDMNSRLRSAIQAARSANMPKEIAQDIAKRIRDKDEKSIKNSTVSGDQHSKMIRAMNEATDESGILTKEALLIELEGLGIPDVSVEHLIGMAELEGLLLRRDGESWTWLQQSS